MMQYRILFSKIWNKYYAFGRGSLCVSNCGIFFLSKQVRKVKRISEKLQRLLSAALVKNYRLLSAALAQILYRHLRCLLAFVTFILQIFLSNRQKAKYFFSTPNTFFLRF